MGCVIFEDRKQNQAIHVLTFVHAVWLDISEHCFDQVKQTAKKLKGWGEHMQTFGGVGFSWSVSLRDFHSKGKEKEDRKWFICESSLTFC